MFDNPGYYLIRSQLIIDRWPVLRYLLFLFLLIVFEVLDSLAGGYIVEVPVIILIIFLFSLFNSLRERSFLFLLNFFIWTHLMIVFLDLNFRFFSKEMLNYRCWLNSRLMIFLRELLSILKVLNLRLFCLLFIDILWINIIIFMFKVRTDWSSAMVGLLAVRKLTWAMRRESFMLYDLEIWVILIFLLLLSQISS